MQTASIHTIIDGADFDRVLNQRVFTDEQTGCKWANATVALYQAKRRDSGERDIAFIEAIYSKLMYIELDNPTLQHPAESFK